MADRGLDNKIFIVNVLIVVFVSAILIMNLIFLFDNYSTGLEQEYAKGTTANPSVIITYARAWDFAVTKTSSIFLSFILIFLGSIYVLRVGETNFSASAEHERFRGTLTVSSPGLVLALLGVGLAALTTLNKSEVSLETTETVQPASNGGFLILKK